MEKIFPTYAETTMQPVADDREWNPGTTPQGRENFARKIGLGKPGESEDARFGRQMFGDMDTEARPGGPAVPDNVPSDDDAIPDDFNAYDFQLGEALEEYRDDEQMAEFKRFAREEAKLSKRQFNTLMGFWRDKAAAMLPDADRTETALRQEWGGVHYERQLGYAQEAVEAAGPEFKSYLGSSPLGNDPMIIKALAAIGRKLAAAYE